jgi:hypothetical protein
MVAARLLCLLAEDAMKNQGAMGSGEDQFGGSTMDREAAGKRGQKDDSSAPPDGEQGISNRAGDESEDDEEFEGDSEEEEEEEAQE